MKPLLVTSAQKSFGETVALAGVSVELGSGELLALLGPNGAGKTTLVRAIAGRVRLDGGTIELGGRPAEAPGARDGLGVVPQEVALYPMLTARENLETFGRLQGLVGGSVREAVTWALGWTGLEGRAGDLVKTYSGGMKRRLNIACGVLHRPRVVLLDEPTVGVDPQSRERIYEMLAELRRDGTSLLLTTHQLDEAESRCDRVVIIDHGKVIAADTREGLQQLLPPTGSSRIEIEGAVDEEVLAWLLARGLTVRGGASAASLEAVFLHLTGRQLRD
jgi:ABC-2 type transport system ATP-binding protein